MNAIPFSNVGKKRTDRCFRVVGAVFALFVVVAFPLSAKDRPGGTSSLRPGQPVSASISLSGGYEWFTSFRFPVTDSTFAIEISIADSPADLDLFLIDSHGDVATYSELNDFNESLFLSRTGDPGLYTDEYTVEIHYQYDAPPEVDGELLRTIPFRLTLRTVGLEPTAHLSPGDVTSGLLLPDNAMMVLYEIEIPDEVEAFRIDLSDTDGDLDLFVHRSSFPSSPYQATYQAQTLVSTESLVVTGSASRPLGAGFYYVMVLDQVTDEHQVSYTLSVTAGDDPPDHLTGIADLPVHTGALDHALLATVELSTPAGAGSGCVVSDNGLVLTNWHVVRGDDDLPVDQIVVGFSLDATRPPAELFTAHVVDYVVETDLALVQIDAGRYGEPIPAGLSFPYFAQLATELPRIGQHLRFVGYPWIGGTGSRASVTYTAGVVSGFQHTSVGTVVKSDGEVNPGNSGGQPWTQSSA